MAEREGFVPETAKAVSRIVPEAGPSQPVRKAKWRRGRDSNPRNRYRFNGFQDRRYRPLSHLSVGRAAGADAKRFRFIVAAAVVPHGGRRRRVRFGPTRLMQRSDRFFIELMRFCATLGQTHA